MVSWLVPLTPDRAVRVPALGIAFCSWARHSTPTVRKMGTGELNAGGNPSMD